MSSSNHDDFLMRLGKVIAGQLTCCHCGHWSPPERRRTTGRPRRIWYCSACGALIEVLPGEGLAGCFIYGGLLFLTAPLAFRVPNWLFTNPSFISGCVCLLIWLLACGLLLLMIRGSTSKGVMTQQVRPHGHCIFCDYDLNHAGHEHCPECGTDARDVVDAIQKWRDREGRNSHD